MSTTTCDAPTRYVSRSARRSASSVDVLDRALEQQRLAEDRRGLGERHRRPALDRRAAGERDVVERVPELVRERRHRVVTAVEVHHHAADVAVDRRAVRAAALAVADLGVDPVLRERARRQARERRRSSRRTRRGRARSRRPTTPRPRSPTGANRSHHGSPSSWPSTSPWRGGSGGIVGSDVDDGLGHRVERGAVDVVRAQVRLEIVREAAPAVEHRELTLGAVQRRGERHRHRLPRRELAVVRGPPARGVGMRREAARHRHRDPLVLAVDDRGRPSAATRRRRGAVATRAIPRARARPRATLRLRSSGTRRSRPTSASANACSPARMLRRGELVDAEDREPGPEPLHQRSERGAARSAVRPCWRPRRRRGESVVTST